MNKKWIIVTLIVVIILGIAYDQHKKYYAYCAGVYSSVMFMGLPIMSEQQAEHTNNNVQAVIKKYAGYDKGKFSEGGIWALNTSVEQLKSVRNGFCKSAFESFEK